MSDTQETQSQQEQEPQENNEYELTLGRKEIKLKKADGTVRECYLEELDGFARDKYLNKEKVKVNRKDQTVEDFTDVHSLLLSISLHDPLLDDKVTKDLVPLKEIREFPSRVQVGLYKTCQKLNGFDKMGEEREKNS